MIKSSSIETLNKYLDLIDEVKFRLNEINETKHYFNSDIPERKAMSKRLNKYIADYIDETLIFLSATSGRVSIIFFTSINGVPVAIANRSFRLVFSLAS